MLNWLLFSWKLPKTDPPAPFWHFSRGVDHCSRGSRTPNPPSIFTLGWKLFILCLWYYVYEVLRSTRTDRSAKVPKQVPVSDGLSRLCKHLFPVFDLGRTTLAAEDHLPYQFVPSHTIVVHDGHDQTRLPDPFVREPEHKHLVENWIQSLLRDRRFSLFHFLTVQ